RYLAASARTSIRLPGAAEAQGSAAESLASGVSWQGQGAIPQKSPCQPNLLECSRLGTRFQVPILYALTLLARVSQVETLCPHRVSFALLRAILFIPHGQQLLLGID